MSPVSTGPSPPAVTRDHRLVQQRQAAGDLPLAEQHASFETARERAQVGVTEAVAVRRGLGRRGARAVASPAATNRWTAGSSR